MTKKKRQLPETLLVGYTTRCSKKVQPAVRQGVNVLIWAFAEFEKSTSGIKCVPKFDLWCAQQMIEELDAEGFADTVHLVSFGGWNGPHFPNIDSNKNSNAKDHALELYESWKSVFGSHFHGLDWDFEGHDNLESPTNVFSVDCLETVGEFSKLANQDGYIVGMAPPQSYLDIESRQFSRRVDWRDSTRGWHDDFQYFGRNVYAYWLSKFGHSIDFVSVQFYESYSRAGLEVFHNKVPPQVYLENYVRDLVTNRQEGFYVDFGDDDPSLQYPNQWVSFPLHKLVWGFANSWGFNDDEKDCYFDPPTHIAVAYESLKKVGHAPRGFMFWVMYVMKTTNPSYVCWSLARQIHTLTNRFTFLLSITFLLNQIF